MNGDTTFPDWASLLQRRAHLLHQQIAAMQRLVGEAGGTEEMLMKACAPYYAMLDEIYAKEMPVARALDRADLLLHLDGEGLQTESPRLSLVTGIMGDVRKQVGAMIRTLVGALNEGLELPREIDLGLCSFAQGSLYLGFSLPGPGAGQAFLAGDPLVTASRQALATLGAVTGLLDEPDAYDLIKRDFADPKLRDSALSAVGQLAPSGRRGVSSVGIGGRALRQGKIWPVLTPQTRERVRSWLERPVLSDEEIELKGQVRAIDLDLRRFDLRRIDGGNLPDLRCIYPASLDLRAAKWLGRDVKIRGLVETYQGVARLMQVRTMEDGQV